MQAVELPFPMNGSPGAAASALEQILKQITAEKPTDVACIYLHDGYLGRTETIACYPASEFRPCRDVWFEATEARLLLEDELTDYAAGIVFPLVVSEYLTGLIVLFSATRHAYDQADLARLQLWAQMIRLALENQHLRQNEIAIHAIQQAAQTMDANSSLQDLVTVLHDHVCTPDVSMCVLLLYGPIEEDHPNGPFSYVEVQGSWLKRFGIGVGIGIRFYIDQYLDLADELNRNKVLSFPNVRTTLFRRLDPLMRSLLRWERAQSFTLIALNIAQRPIGVIAVVTDKPHHFSLEELHTYRTVSEFLALSAMTQLLYQQHDLVQRGRAALLDSVREGILMVLPGPVQAHVLTINDSFSRMFNVGQAAVQGQQVEYLLGRMQIPEDVRAELRQQWFSIVVRDPAVQQGEFNLMGRDGQLGIIEWYSAPVYQNRRVMGRIYIFHDVSAERAATVLRANFVSRISHELRTPLTSIRGFAQFILEAVGDQLPDLAREYTEIILHSAEHLTSVFTDIIEISRADTGQLNLNLENAHLPDVIIEAVALLELDYKKRGQGVIMELDDDLPPVQIDSIRISQVLTNLLTNAIKYSPPDSRIRIITQRVTSSSELGDYAPRDVVLPAVLVTVADEGPGLSAEEAERVFLPFYRANEAHVQKVEGTGLGLAIARSTIELHRGKIWAEPRRRGRRGARFLFTLPTVEQ